MSKNILLVNDDGINATGINELEKAFRVNNCNVFTIAPSSDQSATSHAITIRKEIEVNQIAKNKWSVNGFPADCIALSRNILNNQPIDAVVSGINVGANLGNSVFYSGTVGAAREAQFMGIPAFATSLNTEDKLSPYFSSSAKIIVELVDFLLLENNFPVKGLININFPAVEHHEIKGVKTAILSNRREAKINSRNGVGESNKFYQLGKLDAPKGISGKCFDYDSVNDNYITLTNLSILVEDNRHIIRLEKEFENLLKKSNNYKII